jgi:hypothetical protein
MGAEIAESALAAVERQKDGIVGPPRREPALVAVLMT